MGHNKNQSKPESLNSKLANVLSKDKLSPSPVVKPKPKQKIIDHKSFLSNASARKIIEEM